MNNFLKAALDKVLTEGNQFPSVTYKTPPAIVKYMEMQSALGKPPWKKKRGKELENIKNSLSLFYPLDGVQVA